MSLKNVFVSNHFAYWRPENTFLSKIKMAYKYSNKDNIVNDICQNA